eukprot:7908999-Ditylum_brightwellii.AAC.1
MDTTNTNGHTKQLASPGSSLAEITLTVLSEGKPNQTTIYWKISATKGKWQTHNVRGHLVQIFQGT